VAPAAASPRRRTPHRPAAAAGPFAVAIFAVLVVAAGAVVVPAAPAAAHGSDPSVHPVLDTVEPALPGVTVQLAQSITAQLVVSNPTPTTLSVLDGNGEAFLRIGPAGVLANPASAWWYLTNSPNGDTDVPADSQPGAPPRWEQVAAEPAWGWFEHRLHPSPQGVPPAVSRARRIKTLARWSVPFDFGGQPLTASGRIVYEPVRAR
jgi:hypothetical protein